ncbi:MAG: hypothetical protein PVI30_23665 [Myxococcales bacterium]|jgi:hypothetical protein
MRDSSTRLRPATLDDAEAVRGFRATRPRLALFVLGAALLLAGPMLAHAHRQHRQAEQLRSRILRVGERLDAERQAFEHVKALLPRIAARSRDDAPVGHVRPGLRLAALRTAPGLALHVDLRPVGATPAPAVGRVAACLGVETVSATEVLPLAEELLVTPYARARSEDRLSHLRVLDHELAGRLRNDLQTVRTLARARWALVVVQREDGRDAHLWDMQTGGHLLGVRDHAGGAFMAAHIALGDSPRRARVPIGQGAADDCALSGRVREQLGQQISVARSI